jgi:hypothetical protein
MILRRVAWLSAGIVLGAGLSMGRHVHQDAAVRSPRAIR